MSRAVCPNRIRQADFAGADHKESYRMTIPGMSDLIKDVKALEDYARACRSQGELRMVLITAEEADVIDSFRRFKANEF